MTNKEIQDRYTVVAGTVRSPGKFEGEPAWAVHFWNAGLDGCADEEFYDGDTPVWVFKIAPEDAVQFPDLAGLYAVMIWEADSGFVNSETFTSKNEVDEVIARCEADSEDGETE